MSKSSAPMHFVYNELWKGGDYGKRMRYRALVVEDHDLVADVLSQMLSGYGHRVAVAKDQREAYMLLDRESFDFVLLDLRLPVDENDRNPDTEVGFAILDHIRERYTQYELPVMVMTAFEESSQTPVRVMKAQANDYIRKPFEESPICLAEKIEGIIQEVRRAGGPSGYDETQPLRKLHTIIVGENLVEIDEIEVTGRAGEMLKLLARRTAAASREDRRVGRVFLTGKEIAEAFDIEEASVRQCVCRFRRWLRAEHRRMKKGPIGTQDIIRNARDWKGYGLNLERTRIVFQ